MLRSNEVKVAATNYVTALPPTFNKLVKQLPVMLKAGAFTGSGVIASRLDDRVLVITAKHNIKINYKRHRQNVDGVMDATTYFKRGMQVKVWYTDPHDAERNESAEAGIDEIVFFDNTVDLGKGYDVIGLVIKDEEFLAVTDKILSLASVWGGKRKRIFPLVMDTGELCGNSGEMVDAYLLQVGFGKTQKNAMDAGGTLQHRATKNVRNLVTYLAEDHSGSSQMVVYAATDTNSTWEGDSGGPCFVISRDKKKLWLLGVNLGSNFYANKTDDEDDSLIENNAVTVLNADVEKWLLKQMNMKVTLQRKHGLI